MRQKIIHVTRSHYNMRGKVCQVELIIDNFAGGGGASTGIEMATGRSVDIAINHDYDAIAMHRANHPNTRHYCEDVWQVDPVEACSGNQVGWRGSLRTAHTSLAQRAGSPLTKTSEVLHG